MHQKQVLILCTGNSCRSQMAEAIVNHFLPDQWHAFSAGTHPTGFVHPLALQVLAEIGIRHTGESKSSEVFRGKNFEVVITVCDDAAENCPVWPGMGKKEHISFPDPAKAQGTEEEILTAFRQVRDDIQNKIIHYLLEYFQESEEMPSPEKKITEF